jgi:hypothetical protein
MLARPRGADDTLAVYEHWRKESDVWDVHFEQPYSVVMGALVQEAVVGDMAQYVNLVVEFGLSDSRWQATWRGFAGVLKRV